LLLSEMELEFLAKALLISNLLKLCIHECASATM
jgi:hypothetical protein